jgi:aspartyl-tRNA(Asn)/glutamyl-tRNA(Gln) amidotransferase subunit C
MIANEFSPRSSYPPLNVFTPKNPAIKSKKPRTDFGLSTLRFEPKLSRMASAEIDVKYVAHLARIALTPDEEKKIGSQLGHVLGYIEKLRELDVTKVEPTAHAVPLVNVTRLDEIRPSLPQEDALRNAPRQANGLFIVPKIVE